MNRSARTSELSTLLALALWIGLTLGVVRVGLVFALDRLAHGMELSTSLWRIERLIATTLLQGALAGVALVFPVWWARRRGWLARGAAWCLSSAIGLWLLSGIALDIPSRVPGTETDRGRLAWAVLGLGAGALAALAARAVRVERAHFARPSAPFAPLAVGAVLWLGFVLIVGTRPPPMRTWEVVRALLEEEDAFEIVSTNALLPPRVGAITPALEWRGEAGERPALILAPGGEVRFRIAPEDGRVRLRTAIGVDLKCRRALTRNVEAARFRFEVQVGDRVVFDDVVLMERELDELDYEWRSVGGEQPLELVPGDVVTLRTSVEVIPSGARDRVATIPWRIGFSDLLLEREIPRERTLSSSETPNIVLVLMDTQRRDRMGCYGYERDVSPNLDRLAERGLLFEHANAPSSWTWPSTASLLTGLDPERHGVVDDHACYLARGLELLSEALQANGYTTAAFSGSPLIVPSKGFDQGFEFFDANGNEFRKSRLVVPNAIEWLRTFAGQKLFLYLHLVDPHEPHRPRREDRERFAGPEPADLGPGAFGVYTWSLRRGAARTPEGAWDLSRVVPPEHQRYYSEIYDACVATGDFWVGELLAALDDLGLRDETVFAFTSDHGEEFFEHGMLEHSHSLYPELVDVPLILAGPGIPKGVRSADPVSIRQLAPTLARIGGTRLAAVGDALDLARPNALEPEPVVLGTHHGWWNQWHRTPIFGLREGRWLLHWAPEAGEFGASDPTPGGLRRLYDLGADPAAREDVAAREGERAARMLETLQRALEEDRANRSTTSIPSGAGTQNLLDNIGYTDSEAGD